MSALSSPTSRPGGRGAALILALAAIVIVGALGGAIAAVILGGMRAARAAATRDELLNAAESGADAAISRLAAGTPDTTPRVVKVPGGECRVSIKPVAGGTFEITSRATRARPGGKARACGVQLVVEKDTRGRFRVAEWRLVSGGGE